MAKVSSSAADLPEAFYRGGPTEPPAAGAPIVLVHGIGGSWRNWLPIIPALERRHEVLAVGLLGHHPTKPFAEGVRPCVKALVDGLEQEIDEAGFGRVHLVGNSLGGWVALEMAKRGRVLSVVALSPAGGFEPRSRAAELTAVRLTLEHRITRRWVAPRAEHLVRRPGIRKILFAGAFARPENISATEGLELLRAFGGASAFEDLLRGMRRDGALTELDRIQAPVLLGWGTHDLVLPPRWFAPRLRDGIPGVEYRELPGLGHVPMIDDPELIAGLVLDFVSRHEASAEQPAGTGAPASAAAG